MWKNTINKTILNIIIILFYNVFNTLKRNICLTWHHLIKPQIYCSTCTCNHCRPVDQHRRYLLAVRFYSKWYCAMSGVNSLARRLKLASNRYIVRESANVKLFLYQVISNGLYEEIEQLISNIFFLKYFTINYVLNFLYSILNKKSSNDKFLTRNV